MHKLIKQLQPGNNMAINNIQKLKGFGIFQNHTNASAKNFGKYNLLYGWNGSGKSTLSKVFRCVQNKTHLDKFPLAEFTIGLKDGANITQTNIHEANLNIHTFNHDFIEDNISWSSTVKSILLVDKAKIEDRQKLEELKAQQKTDLETYNKEASEIAKLEESISKFGTDSARHMKMSLQSIDTTDRYFLNYDKRKFESFINDNLEATKSEHSLLTEDKISASINAAKPDQKSTISFAQKIVPQETLIKAEERLNDLLKTSIVSKTIQRLVEHEDVKTWVETGLNLHKTHNSTNCEFCGNKVPEERIKELEEHFNDAYKAFQDRLEKAELWLTSHYIQPPTLPSSGDFYEEFKKEYIDACSSLEKSSKTLNEEISVWHTALKAKTSNPLELALKVSPITEASINEFNDVMKAISNVVEKHNHKSANFKQETDKAKKQLELHYASTEVKNFAYHDKKKDVVERANTNKLLKTAITERGREIRVLEDSLSNEGLGADQFNDSLHKFLGRSELKLRFNPEKKGYEILRNETDPVKGNLSEGEKTAIAFVYFITKLQENDNNIEDTIIVIDDPISSFDSNHLFHAYSFMKLHCEKANQLFVLTHNFTFFKLIRDWISRKNTKEDKNIANCYVIRANNERPRASTYADADSTLTRYKSEYHYIFSRLHSLKNQQSLETDDHFLAANLARKLLEAFLAFKFPKNRGNFAGLFDVGVAACANPADEAKEKIRKFINEYSHNDLIETDEGFVEILAGEGVDVISDIFDWINELDKKHYSEMIDVVST